MFYVFEWWSKGYKVCFWAGSHPIKIVSSG